MDSGESVLVFSPQKSNYGNKYYLNLGVYFFVLGELTCPSVRLCHIQARIENIVPENLKLSVSDILDFDHIDMFDAKNIKIIRSALIDYAYPFMNSINTLNKAKIAEKEGVLSGLPVSRELRELLDSQ